MILDALLVIVLSVRGTVSQSLVMGMCRLFQGPIHSSSSSDCVRSEGHSSGSLITRPPSSLVLPPSTCDSLSPSLLSSLSLSCVCAGGPCAAFSRLDLDAAVSGPVLLVLVETKDALEFRVLSTFKVLVLSVLEKEEVASVEAFPELWKVRRMVHPPSAAVLWVLNGILSSSVAAILSNFLKCLASRELKMGEMGSFRLLLVEGWVFVVFPVRLVRMMDPFCAT